MRIKIAVLLIALFVAGLALVLGLTLLHGGSTPAGFNNMTTLGNSVQQHSAAILKFQGYPARSLSASCQQGAAQNTALCVMHLNNAYLDSFRVVIKDGGNSWSPVRDSFTVWPLLP